MNYEESTGHLPDFEVRYRFLTSEEGGLRAGPPFQHPRYDWLYEGDDISEAGAYMVWPEFLIEDGSVFPEGLPVPVSGIASMWILSHKIRLQVHRAKIREGGRGYFMEGGRRVAEAVVTRVVGLCTNTGTQQKRISAERTWATTRVAHFLIRALSVFLAVISFYICLTIESLNIEAADYLPRQDYPPKGQNPKWRTSPARYFYERETDPSIKRKWFVRMRVDQPRNELKHAIECEGLLQYIVAPLTLLLAACWRQTSKRPLAIAGADVCCIVAAASMCMMFYRGYFSSLGW